jgi:peroxiredoxin
MKKLILLFSTLFCVNFIFAQKDKVTIQIDNYTQENIILCNYFGNNTYIIEKLKRTQNNNFEFYSDTLQDGMYLILAADTSELFSFFIYQKDRTPNFEFDKKDIINTFRVTNSKINEDYNEYLNYLILKSNEIKPYKDQITNKNLSSEENLQLQKHISNINNSVELFIWDMIDNHKDDVLGDFLKANLSVEIKGSPTMPMQERRKKMFERFWNQFNINSDALLRTSVFTKKLNNYLNYMIIQTPDSICDGVDKMMSKIDKFSNNYDYVLWFIANKYETSKVMGNDKVFVHIVDNYLKSLENENIDLLYFDTEIIESLIGKADKIRPTLIGNKAYNLRYFGIDDNLYNLYEIDAKYTIIYFWDDKCDLCTTFTKELEDLYKEKEKYNFEIFGVYTGTSKQDMRKYINDNNIKWINVDGSVSPYYDDYNLFYNVYSTPVIFVLDANKKILAKRIRVEDINKFFKD